MKSDALLEIWPRNAAISNPKSPDVTIFRSRSNDAVITVSEKSESITFLAHGKSKAFQVVVVKGEIVLAENILLQQMQSISQSIRRHLARPDALERWEACFEGDTKLHQLSIGIGIGSSLFDKHFSQLDEPFVAALGWISSILAHINTIFVSQLNVRLLVAHVVIVTNSKSYSNASSKPRPVVIDY